MDPVNPAPAGNPQLTTHLLVSHKKNKNFHPCKVKLRKTKSKYKEAAISNLSQLGFIRASDLKAHPVTFFKNIGYMHVKGVRIKSFVEPKFKLEITDCLGNPVFKLTDADVDEKEIQHQPRWETMLFGYG